MKRAGFCTALDAIGIGHQGGLRQIVIDRRQLVAFGGARRDMNPFGCSWCR